MSKYKDEVRVKLVGLSRQARIIFGLSICESVYDHYVEFAKKYDWGEPNVLQQGILAARQYLVSDSLDAKDVKSLLGKMSSIAPDTEDFEGALVSFALNAASTVYYLLRYLLDDDVENIVTLSYCAIDTVDLYIIVRDDLEQVGPELETVIDNDKFMKEEKESQKILLDKLSKMLLDSLNDLMLDDIIGRRKVIDLALLPD